MRLEQEISWSSVFDRYKAIKSVSNHINRLFGNLLTFFLIATLLDYAISFDDALTHGWDLSDWPWMVDIIVYFGSTGFLLILAADMCNKVCERSSEMQSSIKFYQ